MLMTCKSSKCYRMRKNQVSLPRKIVSFRKKLRKQYWCYVRGQCVMEEEMK